MKTIHLAQIPFICFLFGNLFAQDKHLDFDIESNSILFSASKIGDNEFMVAYGKQLLSKKATKNIMKFDKELQPLWSQPISFTGAGLGGADVYSYTNPDDNKVISYLFGAEQFIQVLSDGTTKNKKTGIPEKELEKIAAVFTDANGLNMITLTGDKKFLTGKMSWYSFSHTQLTLTKKNIVMPLPYGIDDDNESGWKLNEITSNGLYFYYASYKNEVKATGRPILAVNIVKVDNTGKAGNITTLDLDRKKYDVMPASFSSESYSDLSVMNPENIETETRINTTPSSMRGSSTIYTYTDNSYIGVKIDAFYNRIYTYIITNDKIDVSNDGRIKLGMIPKIPKPNKTEFYTFDFTGKMINQKSINFEGEEINAHISGYGFRCNELVMIPVRGTGVVCKFINNDKVLLYVIDTLGNVIQKQKTTVGFSDKMFTVPFYHDNFASKYYYSLDDLKECVYYKKEQSSIVKKFNELDKDAKRQAKYISLKNGTVLAYYDKKKHTLKLNYFSKKL